MGLLLLARSPFGAVAALPCSGQALRTLEEARAFGMTHGDNAWGQSPPPNHPSYLLSRGLTTVFPTA
jgi:hypothetical protein